MLHLQLLRVAEPVRCGHRKDAQRPPSNGLPQVRALRVWGASAPGNQQLLSQKACLLHKPHAAS